MVWMITRDHETARIKAKLVGCGDFADKDKVKDCKLRFTIRDGNGDVCYSGIADEATDRPATAQCFIGIAKIEYQEVAHG